MKSQKLSHAKCTLALHKGFTATSEKQIESSLSVSSSTVGAKPTKYGFALIEVIMVVALVGLILSTGMIIGQSSVGRSYVSSERDTVVSVLVTARGKALANMNESAHGVYISATSTTLFEGISYVLRKKSQDKVIPHISSVTVVPPPLYTLPFYIVFEQLTGNVTSGSGAITLTDGIASSTIVVNHAGRINW